MPDQIPTLKLEFRAIQGDPWAGQAAIRYNGQSELGHAVWEGVDGHAGRRCGVSHALGADARG